LRWIETGGKRSDRGGEWFFFDPLDIAITRAWTFLPLKKRGEKLGENAGTKKEGQSAKKTLPQSSEKSGKRERPSRTTSGKELLKVRGLVAIETWGVTSIEKKASPPSRGRR